MCIFGNSTNAKLLQVKHQADGSAPEEQLEKRNDIHKQLWIGSGKTLKYEDEDDIITNRFFLFLHNWFPFFSLSRNATAARMLVSAYSKNDFMHFSKCKKAEEEDKWKKRIIFPLIPGQLITGLQRQTSFFFPELRGNVAFIKHYDITTPAKKKCQFCFPEGKNWKHCEKSPSL